MRPITPMGAQPAQEAEEVFTEDALEAFLQRRARVGEAEPLRHAQLRFLERVAYEAWPAAEEENWCGMHLRRTGGESRRSNSAALHGCAPEVSPVAFVEAAERFYERWDQPTLFQVGPTAPLGMDGELERRGYGREAPVGVQAMALRHLGVHGGEGVRAEVGVDSEPHGAWVDVQVTHGRFANIASAFLGALGRLGARAGYGWVKVGETPAAAALFVVNEGIMMVSAMRTRSPYRRQGLARALLHAGARWGKAKGATLALLQVETNNPPALGFYAQEGFRTLYGYHYRRRASVVL